MHNRHDGCLQSHHGDKAECRRPDPGTGADTVKKGSHPDHVEPSVRARERCGARGEVPNRAHNSGAPRRFKGCRELGNGAAVFLFTRFRQVSPESANTNEAIALQLRGARDESGPLLRQGSRAVQTAIEFEVHARGRGNGAGFASDPFKHCRIRDSEVDSGVNGSRNVIIAVDDPGKNHRIWDAVPHCHRTGQIERA